MLNKLADYIEKKAHQPMNWRQLEAPGPNGKPAQVAAAPARSIPLTMLLPLLRRMGGQGNQGKTNSVERKLFLLHEAPPGKAGRRLEGPDLHSVEFAAVRCRRGQLGTTGRWTIGLHRW